MQSFRICSSSLLQRHFFEGGSRAAPFLPRFPTGALAFLRNRLVDGWGDNCHVRAVGRHPSTRAQIEAHPLPFPPFHRFDSSSSSSPLSFRPPTSSDPSSGLGGDLLVTAAERAVVGFRGVVGGAIDALALWWIKRTFQPSIIRKRRKTGFLKRKKSVGGRRVLKRRMAKGRARLAGC